MYETWVIAGNFSLMYVITLPVNACTVFVSCLMQSEMTQKLKHLRIHKNSSSENNQILNPYQMFQCTTQHCWNNFFSGSDEKVTNNIKAYELERRYSRCATVSGTKSHHCFTPQPKSTLAMKRLSSDEKELK